MESNEHKHPEDLIKPGNEDYLSYYHRLGKTWEPTKPKVPVVPISSTPGPATVHLPTTIGSAGDNIYDPRKRKAPAYKIGIKDSRQTPSCGPGPTTYDVRNKTNKGSDVCHVPKLGEKLKEPEPFMSPGPGAYNREMGDKYIYRKVPGYSITARRKPPKSFTTPEPTKYTLPDTLGPGRSPFKRSTAYTISGRLDKTGTGEKKPGPASYSLPSTNVSKTKPPAFIMGAKDKSSILVGTVSPGPASNEYHMVKLHKPSTPRFSFGVRHTPNEAFQYFAAEK